MMKKIMQWIMAVLLLMAQGAWATAEPSLTLTEIRKMGECTVYAFNYPSVSATGQPIVLSSALFAWTPADRQTTDSIESLHIFSHITITADDECLTTTSGQSKEQNLLLFLPGRSYNYPLGGEQADYVGRCIVIAPDYEGYGVTKDVPHPYLSQRVTAQQMIDGVKYGLALYQKVAKESQTLLPMKSDWRSFCMGYSQGGAVSLATHREIEEQGLADELHFQGSICGDGPYDLVSTMRYYLEDDGTSYGVETSHRKGLATIPAVVPLILKGMVETHPDLAAYKIADLLSQQLLDTGVLGWIDSKAYNLDNISLKWYEQLQAGVDTLGRQYTPAQMAEMFDSPKVGKVWGKMEKMFSPCRMPATSIQYPRWLPMSGRPCTVRWPTTRSSRAGNRSTASSSSTRRPTSSCPTATICPSAMPTHRAKAPYSASTTPSAPVTIWMPVQHC